MVSRVRRRAEAIVRTKDDGLKAREPARPRIEKANIASRIFQEVNVVD